MNVVVAYLHLLAIHLSQGPISAGGGGGCQGVGVVIWEGDRDICSPKVRIHR